MKHKQSIESIFQDARDEVLKKFKAEVSESKNCVISKVLASLDAVLHKLGKTNPLN